MTAPHPQSTPQRTAHALLTLARERLHDQDLEQALIQLSQAWHLLANPKDNSLESQVLRTQTLYLQGLVAIHKAQWQLALVTLRQALLRAHRSHAEDHPERLEIHNALALAARRVGKFTVAAEHLHLALRHATPDQKLILYRNIVSLELDRNRPEFALPPAQKALELSQEPEQQLLMGRCLLALGRTREAQPHLKIALQSTHKSIRLQSRSLLETSLVGG